MFRENIYVERVNGTYTLREIGGSRGVRGYAELIASPTGDPLPLFQRSTEYGRPNDAHGRFKVGPGYHIIQSAREGDQVLTRVLRIVRIVGSGPDKHKVIYEVLGTYTDGIEDAPKEFWVSIASAISKSNCFNCKSTHYRLI